MFLFLSETSFYGSFIMGQYHKMLVSGNKTDHFCQSLYRVRGTLSIAGAHVKLSTMWRDMKGTVCRAGKGLT